MPDPIITTLTGERGRRYDENHEVVATYGRSIVFLRDCPGVQPGQQVRVELHTHGTDKAGRPMYRAVPAPDEAFEQWRENGDGTASRVKLAKNWLLQTSESEVLETRPLATREETADIRIERKAVLDPSSLEDSFIEEVRVRVISIQSEYVHLGTLLWKEISKREEPAGGDLYPVEEIQGGGTDWDQHRLDPVHEDTQSIVLFLRFSVKTTRKTLRMETSWGELPGWLQHQLEFPYPLCVCGRKRLDTQRCADGYTKCELCRADERCERCGSKQKRVSLSNGHLICDDCKPYEEAEGLIHKVPSGHLEAIVKQTKRLLAGTSLPQEAGEAILRATLSHISSHGTRDRLLQKWLGYHWYYFCEQGVYGTKLSPEALEVLQFLPHACGNWLVELVTWLSETPKPTSDDYFVSTQVKQKAVALPMLKVEDVVRRLAEGKVQLADRLRGSEAERTAAIATYRKAEEELPDGSLVEARAALQEEEQDYTKVLSLLKAAYEKHAWRHRLDDFLAQEYATCPLCNEEVDWSYSHICPEQETLCAAGNFKPFTLKVSRCGEAEIAKIEAQYDDAYHRYSLRLVFDPAVIMGYDPVETELNWHLPTQLEKELVEKIRLLKQQLSAIAEERSRAGRIELVFARGTNPRGKPQLQCETWFAGTIRDDKAEQGYRHIEGHVLFTAWADRGPLPGEVWICTPGRQIGMTKNHLPIVTANPHIKANEQELQEEISLFERELESARKQQATTFIQPFDEKGQANTALAEQLRKAGLI
jgi:hypothetical protein